jgi:hypothetical protein
MVAAGVHSIVVLDIEGMMDAKKVTTDLMKMAKELGGEAGLCFYADEATVYWNGLEFTVEAKQMAAVIAAIAVLQQCYTDK